MKFEELSTNFSRSRRRLLVAAATGTLAALIGGCQPGGEPTPQYQGTDITAVQWGRDFDLTDHDGQRRTLADFRGRVVLLFFGYTNCPGPCPTALAEMAQVVNQLGPDRKQVQGLFVTVDPDRDTADRLAAYLRAFHPSFLGLRGSTLELETVTKEFKVFYQTQKEDQGSDSSHGAGHDNYMVDHSTGIYVLDKSGRA
ncbi:MAG: SCO family protein, partial [Burkholderiales bacterium]